MGADANPTEAVIDANDNIILSYPLVQTKIATDGDEVDETFYLKFSIPKTILQDFYTVGI
jgi:hypothetical protein